MTSKNKNKTALVLAGGGLTGAVYHIGALRAIDDLLVDQTVNDFDIFVGTSAGSLIGALLANKFSPDVMLQTLDGSRIDITTIAQEDVFRIHNLDLISWGLRLPSKVAGNTYKYIRNREKMTFFDYLLSVADALPAGLYDTLGLERYLRSLLARTERSNRFEELDKELYVIATDLDTGERVVFGNEYTTNVPISMAVAASSAVPMLYKPVRIDGREYVDGSLRGNASLDLAIERGAKLVVCINPMVPFDNSGRLGSESFGKHREFLSEGGIRAVADQSLRILSHSGLQYHIKQLRRRHPEVDIILIEPRPDDYQMMYYNIMKYSARLIVARHGFESVTIDLAEDYPFYKEVLARHGIPISRRLVIEELAQIHQSGYNPDVIQKILESHPARCAEGRRDTPVCQLDRTLAQLELLIEGMEA
jgi:predicted acylesterase/phospholipase RssA